MKRICVIGAGPCGLSAVKSLLQAGLRDVVCYEENERIGGNWAFTDDPDRPSVHESTHLISSRRLSSFDDFAMPDDYPDFPSHRQMLAYFTGYARAFDVEPHIRLGSRVELCTRDDDGRWTVRVRTAGVVTTERFEYLLVCSGHHREPVVPSFPGTFAGEVRHSSAYKRADAFRGRRVLVVGAGNSAADVAVDVSRVAASTALSVREGRYVVPKLVVGKPVDAVYGYWRRRLPRPVLQLALRCWLRLAVGRWAEYGLPEPRHEPLDKPPTLNSGLLEALRDGRLVARPGIARYGGSTVVFTDGTRDDFDAVILATGFRTSFPFLPERMVATPPPYLNMMHPDVPDLFFIGLFQPIGCIWRLADYQARIAARRIRRGGPAPARRSVHSGLEVDYTAFRRALLRELSA